MSIKILEESEDKLTFKLINYDISEVNALRRTIISKVPTIAIEDVRIIKNDTNIIDEIISHRLGLVPIFTSLKTINSFNYRNECTNCDRGCELCEVVFDLNVTNDNDNKIMTVYSGQLISRNKNVSIPFKDITILELEPGQSITLKAAAIKGIGSTHAKWSSVCNNANVKYGPDITLNQDLFKKLTSEEVSEFVKSCPRKVYDKKGIVNKEACIFCNECVNVSKQFKSIEDIEDLVTVKPDYADATFVVESVGSLKPRDIVILAIQSIKETLNTVKECIQSGENSVEHDDENEYSSSEEENE